ncbi:MAG: exopolysaccharide biosynthesis polyprenyl glycosylphosphotransferase [Candidatus Paceibacterota bacterium]
MYISNRKEPAVLLLGDLVIFFASLWIALFLRYFEIPSGITLSGHISPFSILFLVWIFIFFIFGLYEKHTLILKNKLPSIILNAQITNSALAVLFFYLIPYFGIAPKTNLFIYLIVSFILISLWRNYGVFLIKETKREDGIIIGSGADVDELEKEINNNERYHIKIIGLIDPDKISSEEVQIKVLDFIKNSDISLVIVDMQNKKLESMLSGFYSLIFSSKTRFVDLYKVYEEIFDRVPVSLIKHSWFLENLSTHPKAVYDILKRVMDIVVSLILGIISLVFYPFVILAIKLDDGGPILIKQDRIGKNNKKIKIIKFRTMHDDDKGKNCLDSSKNNNVTKVGGVLRKLRIDEFPQFWSILTGDLSLIGPRPEMPDLARLYEKEIPYYKARHLIKPGLSGWAQLYQDAPPKFQAQSDQTRIKLSYDLYYIKNRSLFLDFKVALKTIKVLISRTGI